MQEWNNGGIDISQRANSGFNRTLLSVSAVTPFGVGPEITNAAWRGSWSSLLRPSGRVVAIPGVSFQSRAVGVTHEPEPVPHVRGTDAASRETDRSEGVTFSFQVILYKVEPAKANRSLRLFTKDDVRAVLRDEASPLRPEMAIVGEALLESDFRERLAGRAPRPDPGAIGDTGKSQGVLPDSEACEEVTLGEPSEVSGCDIFDAPFIYFTGRYQALANELPQKRGFVGVELVVIGRHPLGTFFSCSSAFWALAR